MRATIEHVSTPTDTLPPPAAARPAPVRPALVRPVQGRRLGGVAAGLAAHTGVPVQRVRTVLVASALLAGLGVALYAVWWFLVPEEGRPADGTVRSDPSAWVLAHRDTLVGVALVVGVGLVPAAHWLDGSSRLAVPLLVVGAGLVLAWSQLDATRRRRLLEETGGGRAAAARVGAGVSLVVVGVVLFLAVGGDVTGFWQSSLAGLAVLVGVGIVLAPWAIRLWQDLGAERAALAREQERAELAAHVHDSVLQTLALIQKRSADAGEVARLARMQERDLRRWLYGDHGTAAGTLGAALRAAAAEVEDACGATVEVVLVGDLDSLPLGKASSALAQASREALLNAGRHAGGTVSLYAEAVGGGLEVFVRDRGPGFDLDAVPHDRLGVRESIVGRMHRAGGSATVRRPADGGTEVALRMPGGGA